MLQTLCGSKNIQKILLFLFVNGKGYGTQLHKTLKSPLTPLQKALNRLEKGGILLSSYEGKTRLYQFNPGHPLMDELQSLLKKAYTLLPAHEKKNYYVFKEDLALSNTDPESKTQILLHFWERLGRTKQLTFHARSNAREESGWKGNGKGEVIVSRDNQSLIFNEKGIWTDAHGNQVNFSNIFRWTLDRTAKVISLEHLRRGPDHPVFLFHLAPAAKDLLSSVDSHLCGGDTYFGQFLLDAVSLRLNWRVIGPKKNEEIDYYYS
ncbi:MAG: winged helix-turn-helix domain-containing protein [Parachlamydia sp.]|jgi:hypothetical protein|nr:winged helix-turn-helix domain-containing protein [Parachlamydia sp.]